MCRAPTILICDDEEALRELVRVTLDGEYRFVEAEDGVEALDLARALRPDLVICDLMLPTVGGLEVVARLRAEPELAGCRVVVLSAWTHAAPDALAAGADRFVGKPFDPAELTAVVEELLAA